MMKSLARISAVATGSVPEHHGGAGIIKLLLVPRDKRWDGLRVRPNSVHSVAIIIQTGLKVLVFLPEGLKASALLIKIRDKFWVFSGNGVASLQKLGDVILLITQLIAEKTSSLVVKWPTEAL